MEEILKNHLRRTSLAGPNVCSEDIDILFPTSADMKFIIVMRKTDVVMTFTLKEKRKQGLLPKNLNYRKERGS